MAAEAAAQSPLSAPSHMPRQPSVRRLTALRRNGFGRRPGKPVGPGLNAPEKRPDQWKNLDIPEAIL